MKQFDLYDILGFLAPGMVAVLGVLHYYPERFTLLRSANLTAGEFGAMVLVAYIAGNLVAGISTFLGKKGLFGDFPTNRVRCNDGSVITKKEFAALEKTLRDKRISEPDRSIENLDASEWSALTREIHSYLDARGLARRVEMFNAKFGMNRNLFVAFLLLIALSMVKVRMLDWKIDLALIGCAGWAYYRVREFALVYAQTMFRTFLTAPEKPLPMPPGSGND